MLRLLGGPDLHAVRLGERLLFGGRALDLATEQLALEASVVALRERVLDELAATAQALVRQDLLLDLGLSLGVLRGGLLRGLLGGLLRRGGGLRRSGDGLRGADFVLHVSTLSFVECWVNCWISKKIQWQTTRKYLVSTLFPRHLQYGH